MAFPIRFHKPRTSTIIGMRDSRNSYCCSSQINQWYFLWKGLQHSDRFRFWSSNWQPDVAQNLDMVHSFDCAGRGRVDFGRSFPLDLDDLWRAASTDCAAEVVYRDVGQRDGVV